MTERAREIEREREREREREMGAGLRPNVMLNKSVESFDTILVSTYRRPKILATRGFVIATIFANPALVRRLNS